MRNVVIWREEDQGLIIVIEIIIQIKGPLLFVLFTNDIASYFDNISCVCKLYADDVKLYIVLQTETDYCLLQSKLNELYEWS